MVFKRNYAGTFHYPKLQGILSSKVHHKRDFDGNEIVEFWRLYDHVIGGRSYMWQNKDKCRDLYFGIVMEAILVVILFIAVGCQEMSE